MLSTENPPTDPSSSCNFSHLTASNELDQSFDHHHPLTNFSIRDYVNRARSKDIRKNWPFSQKGLQLCLIHGIKDPLPPFQPLDSVRNQSSKSRTSSIETCSPEEKHTKNNVVKDISASLSDQCKQDDAGSSETSAKLCKGLDHSGVIHPRVEHDFPSTITAVSELELESVSFNRPPGKKSGQLSKSGASTNRGSTEDIGSSSIAVSELMASKTCPVCKTFSSTSNTTLNAHIDQCLSADSKPADPKPIRHRIKPRRIRLMTDVYATAKLCTLEELDRRNGTSWAMLSSLPVRSVDKSKSEEHDKGKKQKVSSVHPDDDNNGVHPVYKDASGVKLRNLSELNDDALAVLKEVDVGVKKKSLEGGKASEVFLKKKKSHRGKKRLKYLKLVPQSRKLLSHKANASQISECQEGYFGEGSCKEEQQIPKELKLSQPGTLRHRTKKLKKHRCKWHLARSVPVENDQPYLRDSTVTRNKIHHGETLHGNTVSSPINSQGIWKACPGAQVTNKVELIPMRKRGRNPLSLPPVEQNTKQLPKKSSLIWEKVVERPPQSTGRMFCADIVNYSDASSSAASLEPSMSLPAFASKGSRFSSLREKAVFSTSQPSATEVKTNAVKKLKKTQLHFREEEEELVEWEPEMNQEFALTDSDADDNDKVEEIHFDSVSSFSSDDDENDKGKDVNDAAALHETNSPETSGETAFSLDAEFFHSDSPQSTEDYNEASCKGEEALVHQAKTNFLGGQERLSTDEEGNVILGQTVHMEIEFSEVGQENSCTEVDPIPIPGPPGSFLPSPRDMGGSNEFPGSSSLTTSHILSFHDQLDFTDRNSSESSISVASTVSNSVSAKSDHLNYPGSLSSVPEKIATVNFPLSQQGSAGAEQNSMGAEFSVQRISIDKRTFGFRSDDQPCCCQRKEKFFEGVALNFQESQLLKRRTMSSVGMPETRSQMGFSPTSHCTKFDMMSNMFAPSSFSNPSTAANGVRRETMSPSGSNPVLRLMGKNLMVVNNGEEAPAPPGQAKLNLQTKPQAPQYQNPSRTSPCSLPKSDNYSFQHLATQGSLAFRQNSHDGTSVDFDASNSFQKNANSPSPETPGQVPAPVFQNHFDYVPYFSPGLS